MERWPLLDPGELHHKVQIQAADVTTDDDGSIIETWRTIATVWANPNPTSGGERWKDAALATSNLFIFKMRYFRGLTTKNRILFDGRTFDIKNVQDVNERGIIHMVTCLERQYDEPGRRTQ